MEGTPYTYADLLEASLRIAAHLRSEGFVRGDRAAILMDNSWPCVVSIFGTLMAGGVFLVVNAQTKSDKLRHILNDSGAKVLLTDGNLSRVFLPVLGDAPSVQSVICSGNMPESPAVKTIPFEQILAGSKPTGNSEVIPLDLAALIYTSGSTGNPKGVMMTHQAMTFTTGSLVEYLRLNVSTPPRVAKKMINPNWKPIQNTRNMTIWSIWGVLSITQSRKSYGARKIVVSKTRARIKSTTTMNNTTLSARATR